MSLERDIKSLVASLDLELYETTIVNEYDETIYRVSVISSIVEDGKRKGVSLDECVALTHLISPLLDVTPPVSGEYRLEVSSAGIERKIGSLEQFRMCVGERVSLLLRDKRKLKGVLQGVEGDILRLQTDESLESIAFSEVSKAKTYFEW